VEKTLSAREQDVSLDLQAIRSPHRSFWQKRPMEVLPRIIRQAHPDYALTCGPCASNPNTSHTMLVPHVTFYN
jgi:hypothetical protein